jgi:quinoprotein glucose dehydrogenase
VLTASGLLFIGATVRDHKLRAFDARDGKLLWQTELPSSATATPAIYEAGGRQFVVIAASGGKDPNGAPHSSYVAFALRNR